MVTIAASDQQDGIDMGGTVLLDDSFDELEESFRAAANSRSS
jgi:hypothetical protein